MNIIKSSTCMYLNTNRSGLETECLFGEVVEILDEYQDWVYCRLDTDNYCGWIKKNDLGFIEEITHKINIKRTYIYKDNNSKSDILLYLPMGSNLTIEEIQCGWAKTSFFVEDKIKIGYVPSTHIVDCNHKVKDWVVMAEQLLGTPYRWGGRDTIGIDCSALLQLSYQTYGQNIPRNSSQQVKLKKKYVENIRDLRRGCVVFWRGHVGIMTNKINCIHSNAFHMKTIIEPLENIIKRTDGEGNIIKMMDFN